MSSRMWWGILPRGRSVLFFLSLLGLRAAAEGMPHASLEVLARDSTWHRLLHYNAKAGRSDVRSEDFFLTENGPSDPEAELEATIALLATPWDGDWNLHPRCRFPARYLWLSRRIGLPGYIERDPRCRNFERWADFDHVRSMSILLVSGYFGNPASTFGHSLLRINKGGEEGGRLLDRTVNFGAIIPDKEPLVVYAAKGLLGGYAAGFSAKRFYAEDFVYARTELRDMWEYELIMPQFELQLLVSHLWEIIGRRFPYYFLRENCAFRMGELLQVAGDYPWLKHSRFWFAPVELFHNIEQISSSDSVVKIGQVNFLPSSQREFNARYAALPDRERAAFNKMLSVPRDFEERLSQVPAERRPLIVDTLLSYMDVKFPSANEPAPFATNFRARVLLKRLQMGTTAFEEVKIPAVTSPARLSYPMLTAIGVGADGVASRYLRVEWAGFSYDGAGQNAVANGEFVVLDVVGGIDTHGRGLLERVNLLRIQNLNADRLWNLTNLDSWSWQVRAGGHRVRRGERNHFDFGGGFGAGRAGAFEHAQLYMMADVVADSSPSPLGFEPNAGVVVQWGRFRSSVRASERYDLFFGKWRSIAQAALGLQISQHYALRVEALRDSETRLLSISLHHYW